MDRNTDPTRRPDHGPAGGEPRRITLWCGACGASRAFTREQAAGYLERDWPECCGRAMGVFPGILRGTKNPAG